jgi:hypothetical protein
MFTGFASENTPAIQVWDFFNAFASTSALRVVSLADDCAPIQFFRTGATTTAIQVYLPSAPIEGKQLQIINQSYNASNQFLQIRTSDNNGNGTFGIPFTVGPGASITLVYCKNSINFGVSTGNNQTGWLSLNFGSPAAGNFNAVIVGNPQNIASANSSSVLGGTTNSATGSTSTVVGGSSNTASNTYASVVGGIGNAASGSSSAIVGGDSHISNSSGTIVLGGSSNTASNTYASVVGGFQNTANGVYGSVIGGRAGTNRSIAGAVTMGLSNLPVASGSGVQQTSFLILGRETYDATATVLTSTTAAASTTNQVILPNNSAYYFKGSIVAGVTGAGNSSAWTFEGLIKRGANAASTVIVQSTVNLVGQDTGASTWIAAISADTTNGGLAVTCTGQASTTIRWVCKVETTEMTY